MFNPTDWYPTRVEEKLYLKVLGSTPRSLIGKQPLWPSLHGPPGHNQLKMQFLPYPECIVPGWRFYRARRTSCRWWRCRSRFCRWPTGWRRGCFGREASRLAPCRGRRVTGLILATENSKMGVKPSKPSPFVIGFPKQCSSCPVTFKWDP